jgi:hypothetical protein
MAPRSIALAFLLAAIGASDAAALLRSKNNNNNAAIATDSSLDVPTIAESRHHRRSLEDESEETVSGTVAISTTCLNNLVAAADESGKLGKENYFVYTDGMSNGYFTLNGMTDYSSLPMENKFTFVTLSCQCIAFGGRDNCCQGDRAKIDLGGIDAESPENMSEQLQSYVADICTSTVQAIGEENILPPTGEETETASPVAAPVTAATTSSSRSTGLSGGAWAGIGLASAATLALFGYFAFGQRTAADQHEEVNSDADLEQMEDHDVKKESSASTPKNSGTTGNGGLRSDSPDGTHTMLTFSDSESLSTNEHSITGDQSIIAAANKYYENNSLLPGAEEEEDSSMQNSSSTNDEAIESGNWEQVAASAAAFVKQNESSVNNSKAGWAV